MRVRSNSESVDRYLRNSMRAFLDGEQNLKWICGLVDHSGAGRARTQYLFLQIAAIGSNERRKALANFLEESVQDPG